MFWKYERVLINKKVIKKKLILAIFDLKQMKPEVFEHVLLTSPRPTARYNRHDIRGPLQCRLSQAPLNIIVQSNLQHNPTTNHAKRCKAQGIMLPQVVWFRYLQCSLVWENLSVRKHQIWLREFMSHANFNTLILVS